MLLIIFVRTFILDSVSVAVNPVSISLAFNILALEEVAAHKYMDAVSMHLSVNQHTFVYVTIRKDVSRSSIGLIVLVPALAEGTISSDAKSFSFSDIRRENKLT